MRILDRYIAKELIVPFLVGTLSVVLMFQANELIYWYKMFSIQTVPPLAIAQAILFKTPYFLNLTLPAGMALASSLAFSRYSREFELTAMRSAGASILRITMPAVAFGVMIAGLNFFIVEYVTPRAEKASRDVISKFGALSAAPDFVSNVMLRLGNRTVSIGTAAREPSGAVRLTDVILIERPRAGEAWIYWSAKGVYESGVWRMDQADFYILRDNQLITYRTEDVVVNEPITIQDLFLPPEVGELTLEQLREAIETGRKQGADVTNQEIILQTRFAVPAACIIFGFVGPLLSVWLARSGGFVGVLLSIFLVFLYYNAFVISTNILGPNRIVVPWLAAWLPNILFILAGLIVVRRLE
ncbi:MAG: LptF/LptG family permease [Fimbriimonadaceae bacterium]